MSDSHTLHILRDSGLSYLLSLSHAHTRERGEDRRERANIPLNLVVQLRINDVLFLTHCAQLRSGIE